MSKKAKPTHYIDNENFFEEMVSWKKQVIEAEESADKRPPINEYIGKCFLDIAQHLAQKPNFANYPYKDEMISDAVENCLLYAHNFNPEKSKNPFSYFTQITYYAFLRRIEKEKKQQYIKYKITEMNDDGTLSSWFKSNYFEKDTPKDAMKEHFSISDTDLERLEPKKKKKK
tara:strand:- start:3308 stop:3823 length:516 start_codon:yes stop_codon:yes gene_type:complete